MILDLAMISLIWHCEGTDNKKKLDKLYFIKMKKFCASKDTINRVKKHPTEWKKIFTNHTTDKELISRIYRELLKLNTKKKNNNLIKNG